MPTIPDPSAFESCHRAFLRRMRQASGGVEFSSFQHPHLLDDEIAYKLRVYSLAKERLKLKQWMKWKDGSGRILAATKLACGRDIGANWLEHRFGAKGNSDSPLYRVSTKREIGDLEGQLRYLMLGGSPRPEVFRTRFDRFAEYLREHSLGCKWPFVTHLSFLLDPTSYFPVKPDSFDDLLQHYHIAGRIAGRVEWDRYAVLLELADWLRHRLAVYGNASAVEIQSYMWVVSYLGADRRRRREPRPEESPNFAAELDGRKQRAFERERRGLLGEQFVFDREKRRLIRAGRSDLALAVRLMSAGSSRQGYDIKSFDKNGKEQHIEVKTTARSQLMDDGFWLSDSERMVAEADSQWCVVRVWDVDSNPHCRNLGNVIKESHGWNVEPDTWFVSRMPNLDDG